MIPDEVKRKFCTCIRKTPEKGEKCVKCGKTVEGECYTTCSGFILAGVMCRDCHDKTDDCVPPEVKLKYLAPILHEFAKWLRNNGYDRETVEQLLFKEWDGAYPEKLLGDDIIVDIENFLHDMAYFAVQKVFGESVDCDQRFRIEIVPYGNYEDCSSVHVLEMNTRTVLASLEEKTWHFNPELLEEDLKDLIEQLEKAKELLAVRLVSDP